MSTVTRHALRVYSALSGLQEGSDDVLDALIPFFEPILEVTNGKIFDPRVFAVGVQKLYRWRFTVDIAEHFIPRLVRKGFLVRHSGDGRRNAYVVKFVPQAPSRENLPITEVLNQVIDKFVAFSPRVTDLLHYSRTRDELADILIRFLVSLDAYGDASFAVEMQRLQLGMDESSTLAGLEEGGTPLNHDDRYMCARFVKYLSTESPEYIPHLARLASIGLLTEVVEDFARPITTERKVDLTIAVDAPLALDFLGCSGTALKDDVRRVFDALKSIGCRFVVFPITCDEVQRNLKSMLSNRPAERYGYTHGALLRREVMPEYVQAVATDPESALEKAGIQVKPLTLSQYPNSHKSFSAEYYQDFFSSIFWVADVAPREHDATCVALLMRLREGRHHSDLFRCRYVLVTRNATFVRESRKYCLASRLINERQEGPVIHQRELATLAWLRTGLGIAEQIPRGHLLAVCEQVLRVRMEVSEAVGKKLREVTPEKIEQFELLLQDHRSVRKLADETLNDETVVTADNAEQLLEAMRKATIAEEREEFERNLQEQKKRHSELQRKARAETTEARNTMLRAEAEREEAKAALEARKERDKEAADEIARRITRRARLVEKAASIFLLLMGGLAILQYFTGWLSTSFAWTCVLAVAGFIGLYDFITNRLEQPKVGIPTLLKWHCRLAFSRALKRSNLPDQSIDQFEFEGCRIRRKIDGDYV